VEFSTYYGLKHTQPLVYNSKMLGVLRNLSVCFSGEDINKQIRHPSTRYGKSTLICPGGLIFYKDTSIIYSDLRDSSFISIVAMSRLVAQDCLLCDALSRFAHLTRRITPVCSSQLVSIDVFRTNCLRLLSEHIERQVNVCLT